MVPEVTYPGWFPSLGEALREPVTLAANRALLSSDLGREVSLAGFTLALADPEVEGSCTLVGPGAFTGGLAGSLVAGQNLVVSVIGGSFSSSDNPPAVRSE